MSPAAILLVVFAFFQKVGDGQRVHLRVYVPQSPKELSEKLWKRLQASAQIEKATALVTCTICLEDILPGQPVRRLRCGHLNLGCDCTHVIVLVVSGTFLAVDSLALGQSG